MSVDVTPYRKKEKSSKLQTCWEGQYIITTWINVIYRIQRHPRAKMMVVHLDRLAPYLWLLGKMTLRRDNCKRATAPSSVATREAFDVKAAGMP